MGACGINMGTRFMATQECNIHDDIKQALVNGSEDDTELLMRGRNTLRVYKNSAAVEAKQLEIQHPKAYDKLPRCTMAVI
jgi:NAD(P)H-dependent flavin oxidoreductase YrpB (nitropropane dioxygenase family)